VWFRRFHASPESRRRLICFPHAGGSASSYVALSAELHPEVEVLAVQYPGRQNRIAERPILDIMTLADRIFAALRPWLADSPTLFGHSMGAIVAFEVARRMENEGGFTPARLVASGHWAPSRRRPQRAHRRDDDLIAELVSLGGTEAGLLADGEFIELMLSVIRSDFQAIESYVAPPAATLRCPVTVFVGNRDPHVPVDEAQAWSEHTTARFDLHVFDGGHFFLRDRHAEFARRLAAVLRADGLSS
jgi:pyochelin biosynthesis protein PchC